MKQFPSSLIILAGLASGLFGASSSLHLEVGALYGTRSIADSEIKSIYGGGYVYFPYVALAWKGVLIGGGYEGGYSKRGAIGLFEEPSTLKITGYEFFIGYLIRMKKVAPYVKVGFGSYAYQQKIESPYVESFRVDHKKMAVGFSAGVRVFLFSHLFLSGEAKFVPLRVRPFEEEVDLSGVRLLAGVGLTI